MNSTPKREDRTIVIACYDANCSVLSIAVMQAVSSLCRSQTPHESHHLGSNLLERKTDLSYIFLFGLSMLSARINRNYDTSF
jgi:hypothetical protein